MKSKEQPSLFDSAEILEPPSQRHSPTSIQAAEDIKRDVNRLQGQVYDFIKDRGQDGATDEEGIEALHMSPSTYRPRRVELMRLYLIRDSGRTRLTHSGRSAVVWQAN